MKTDGADLKYDFLLRESDIIHYICGMLAYKFNQMIEENQLISHLYQNRDNGQWMIQTNDEHQKGVADMAASFAGQFGLPSWGACARPTS